MITETLLKYAAAPGAIADGSQDQFRVPAYAFRGNVLPSIIMENLAATEVVTLWISDLSGYQQVYDDQATPVEAVLDPTNNKTTITVRTPGIYGITKTDTAAATRLLLKY